MPATAARVHPSRHTCRCPQCDSRDVIHHGHETRSFKTVPIGHKPVTIVLPIPRIECRACKIIRQVALLTIMAQMGSFVPAKTALFAKSDAAPEDIRLTASLP